MLTKKSTELASVAAQDRSAPEIVPDATRSALKYKWTTNPFATSWSAFRTRRPDETKPGGLNAVEARSDVPIQSVERNVAGQPDPILYSQNPPLESDGVISKPTTDSGVICD